MKIISSPHTIGFVAVDFQDDGAYNPTLSAQSTESGLEQELCIWAWSSEDEFPVQRAYVPSGNVFHEIRFSHSNSTHVVTTSDQAVHYWDWSGFTLGSYKGNVYKIDIGISSGEFNFVYLSPRFS